MADFISIVVASYNYEAFIRQTLESIQAQSLRDWEVLVVDDGSSDGSVRVIKAICDADSRFKLLQHEGAVNRGLAESLKLGISNATGEWIAFCESDDWWDSTFLEALQARAKSNPVAGVVFSDVVLEGCSEAMNVHCRKLREHFRRGGSALELYKGMCNAVPTFSCAMARTGLLKECDFRAHFPPSLDMWIWAQLVGKTAFEYVDKPLCHWRQHDQSYMKKEVDPAALDMKIVLEFHDQMRSLLQGVGAQNACDSAALSRRSPGRPRILQAVFKGLRIFSRH